MNTHDIELPPLPSGNPTYEFPDGAYDSEQMHQYARAAIEADRKRRGKPVDIRQEVIETLEMILAADWRKWEELASPDEFIRWAKSRANYALSIINEAPQPAEPSRDDPVAWLWKWKDLSDAGWQCSTVGGWRERFPSYEYRPQDDCVSLKMRNRHANDDDQPSDDRKVAE